MRTEYEDESGRGSKEERKWSQDIDLENGVERREEKSKKPKANVLLSGVRGRAEKNKRPQATLLASGVR